MPLLLPQAPGLGPPRPAQRTPSARASPMVVAPVGAFAELQAQLELRKQQLAGQQATPLGAGGQGGGERPGGATPGAGKGGGEAQANGAHAAEANGGGDAGAGIKPRGGVRRGAIGPLLARLRSQAAQGEAKAEAALTGAVPLSPGV